jgi:outer membrane protein TolC
MRTIIISLTAILATGSLFAQNNVNTILASIEENNTTLKALRESVEAQKLENLTGIYLSDPEIGFNYLWGNPGNIGNRTDFSVTQTFDIPTITGMKNRVADGRNHLLEWQYKADRMKILLEAKQYCIELTYCNALMKELDTRLEHAETIAAGYEERMHKGDANILEYNKVRLNLSTVQGEISRLEVERNALIEQLTRLNGGQALSFDDNPLAEAELPSNFDDWYIRAEEKNPVLAFVKQEVEVSKKQVSLSKATALPTFSAGYMSEKVVGQHYQGVSVGISIPLWGNKNRVKQAKAAVRAAQSRETDSKQQFYGQLQILYNRTLRLKTTADTYRKSLETANNSELLKKALDTGEISLLDYILEIGLYYDTVNRALEAERDYQKVYAELSAVEL